MRLETMEPGSSHEGQRIIVVERHGSQFKSVNIDNPYGLNMPNTSNVPHRSRLENQGG